MLAERIQVRQLTAQHITLPKACPAMQRLSSAHSMQHHGSPALQWQRYLGHPVQAVLNRICKDVPATSLRAAVVAGDMEDLHMQVKPLQMLSCLFC